MWEEKKETFEVKRSEAENFHCSRKPSNTVSAMLCDLVLFSKPTWKRYTGHKVAPASPGHRLHLLHKLHRSNWLHLTPADLSLNGDVQALTPSHQPLQHSRNQSEHGHDHYRHQHSGAIPGAPQAHTRTHTHKHTTPTTPVPLDLTGKAGRVHSSSHVGLADHPWGEEVPLLQGWSFEIWISQLDFGCDKVS